MATTWQDLLDAMRLRPLLCYLALAACYEDPGDLYDLLNISPQANPQEVKKAYRALSMQWHPDKNAGNEEEAQRKFVEVRGGGRGLVGLGVA